MTRWIRGALTGALALTFLEILVTDSRAASGVSGAAATLASAVRRLLDASVPAIPDLRSRGVAAPQRQSGAASNGAILGASVVGRPAGPTSA